MSKSLKGKNAMMKMAINQSLKGQVFIVGQGPDGEATLTPTQSDEQEPYRIIDGQPVYHVSKNTFHDPIPYWESNRVHKWGFIYHPNLLGSCFPIPATATFYIDTRVPGYYILWTRTASDDENALGMYPSHDVIAWTPRVKGDNIESAGYRLVHSFMLEILMVKAGEWHCDPDFAGGIICSMKIEWIIGAIAFSQQNSKKEIEENLKRMPTYLRDDYRKLARIVPKGTPWPESTCWG
jgi:hypothetical protein